MRSRPVCRPRSGPMNARRAQASILAAALSVLGGAAYGAGPPPPPPPAAPLSSAAPLPPALERLDRASTPAERADRAFLEHLGWRFVVDPAARGVRVVEGAPATRSSLAVAQAAGDLRILVPTSPSPDDLVRLRSLSSSLADSIASRAAWQFMVAPAVERATSRLAAAAARGTYVFPHWGPMHAQVFSMAPPPSAWVRRGKIEFARRAPSEAIEAFYREPASTECYVAQTVAAYAIQYELHGARGFDETFAADEIAIGQVDHFHETVVGRTMDAPEDCPWRALFLRPSDRGEDPGSVLGRIGPMAFPGLTGILMDQAGRSRSNQNFTFVSVTPAAAAAFVQDGGFARIARDTDELLGLHAAQRARFATGADLVMGQARIRALLADPVFTGVRLYVHPYGVVTLGDMVMRLVKKDRTAVGLILYPEAREDWFYARYREAWKRRATSAPSQRRPG